LTFISFAYITEVAEEVYRFETPISFAEYKPTVYLIREPQGVLVEPGPSATVSTIQEAMEQLGMKDLAYIIPTHIHMDHAGGAGALAQLFPQSRVVVHPRGLKHAVEPSRLIDSVKMVWGENFEDHFGPIVPVVESRIKAADDGEIITASSRELQIFYAPGHAPHHIVIFDRKVEGIFCGEALGLPEYQMPTVAPMSFNLETYLASIERLQQLGLGAKMLFYSHGSVEKDPDMLMARAAENARAIGDMVLQGLKHNESPGDIGRRVGEHVAGRYGLHVDQRGLDVTVAGYRLYFESKGLA
jgi:glyoxylase-like metal-dependent hydrolase (beta-lactamase superfamily II)